MAGNLENEMGLPFERFNVRPMRFRTRHVADSVVDRLLEMSTAVSSGGKIKEPTDSTVALARGDSGELIVTKTLTDGTVETMTIDGPADDVPDVTPGEQPGELQDFTGADSGGIVESAALGGDSLDALLKG